VVTHYCNNEDLPLIMLCNKYTGVYLQVNCFCTLVILSHSHEQLNGAFGFLVSYIREKRCVLYLIAGVLFTGDVSAEELFRMFFGGGPVFAHGEQISLCLASE
jgi:hypothetical protein